jgi:L,D-transpeptidase ErfK/SrfK
MPHAAPVLAAVLLLVSGPGTAVGQIAGSVHTHAVQRGETLGLLAARHGTSPQRLAAINGRRVADRLVAGTPLLIDTRHLVPTALSDGLVINPPQRMLFVVEQGIVFVSWPVAAGRPDWPTPTGSFVVVTREVDPTWDVPSSIQQEMTRQGKPVRKRVAPGPENPLGDRWLGLGPTGIGVHGTNVPGSIYRLGTHGCIRLHPEDMRVLFDRAPLGTPVSIVYEPILAARVAGRVLLEVHPDAYARLGDPVAAARARVEALGVGLTPDDLRVLRAIVGRCAGYPEVLLDQD